MRGAEAEKQEQTSFDFSLTFVVISPSNELHPPQAPFALFCLHSVLLSAMQSLHPILGLHFPDKVLRCFWRTYV